MLIFSIPSRPRYATREPCGIMIASRSMSFASTEEKFLKLSTSIISSATPNTVYGRVLPCSHTTIVSKPSSLAPFNICRAEWLPRVAILLDGRAMRQCSMHQSQEVKTLLLMCLPILGGNTHIFRDPALRRRRKLQCERHSLTFSRTVHEPSLDKVYLGSM